MNIRVIVCVVLTSLVVATYLFPFPLLSLTGSALAQDSVLDQNFEEVRRSTTDKNLLQWIELDEKTRSAESEGDYYECLELAQTAIDLAEAAFPVDSEYTLSSRFDYAHCLEAIGKFQEAVSRYRAILKKARKKWGDEHKISIYALNALGLCYAELRRYDEAEAFQFRAIAASETKYGDTNDITNSVRHNLGQIYLMQKRLSNAENIFQKTLAARLNSLGPTHPNTLSTKNNLASVYLINNRFNDAEKLFSEVLSVREKIFSDAHPDLITSLNNLASVYSHQGQHSKAEELLQRAYTYASGYYPKDSPAVSRAAGNLAGFYRSVGDGETAERHLIEALSSASRVFGYDNDYTLNHANNLAALYTAAGHYDDAESILAKVLNSSPDEQSPIYIAAFTRLALLEMLREQPEIALILNADSFFHAQSQRNLDPDIRGFIQSVHYNILGHGGIVSPAIMGLKLKKNDLLTTDQNAVDAVSIVSKRKFESSLVSNLRIFLNDKKRVSESELIGRLSKSPASESAATIPLTPLEREWEARLSVMHEPGPDGQEVTLEEYTRRMDAWLEEVAAIPEEQQSADWESFGTSLQDGVLDELLALGDDIGMLQIASFDDQTDFFVLTPKGRFQHHKMDIGEEEIAELIFKARDQLGMHDPDRSSRDPLPGVSSVTRRVSKEDVQDTLKKLHGLLLPDEVTTMLEAAGTKHLVLNLQGRIRYAPFGALYDGETYLTQRYGLSRFTWGDLAYDAPQGMLSHAAGFGMSQSAEVDNQRFKALPGVETELKAIFAADGTAVLPSNPKFNMDFTRKALVEAMAQKPSILHISSHFDMRPGQDAGNSFLLLGDGTPLTLKEINAAPDITFEGVDLLVLSACSTARSTEGSGIEVEGLGAIAQLKGADAVMATMWNVADASTSKFMAHFYTELLKPDVDKAKAIQNTQEAFITGTIKSSDPAKEYSHPYYWAPYILMGNWK